MSGGKNEKWALMSFFKRRMFNLPSPPPVYISFFHPSRRLCPVVVLAVATTVPSRCICKIFIVCSSRAFNILEILANKHRQSSLLFKDQLPSSSSSPTLEELV
uniref:Uncharacterized protein n=1 Tax=Cucumis melo TaxID=3656 RepID=A0A9I9EFF3_CUCME